MKKNENGRSMVEMLGVLAIIGVLSVGGIIGYTIAMRKYRANEIAQAVSMLAVEASTTNQGAGIEEDTSYTTLIENAALPVGLTSLTAIAANGKFSKTIQVVIDDDKELCLTVANILGTSDTNPLRVQTNDCGNTQVLTVKTK